MSPPAAGLRPPARAARARRWLPAVLPLVLSLAASPAVGAQDYDLRAPAGGELSFSRDTLLAMHEATRLLREDLERDPEVLYFTGFTPPVPEDSAARAMPWNAVQVLTDSTAAVRTPGNLREAERAYSAYAVVRMRNVRSDPDVSCDSLMAREVEAVSAFVDGWIVARTLFGGPPYAPLTELAFARDAGVLPGLVAAHGNEQLGGCLGVWREEHERSVHKYRRWREERFAARGDPAGVGSPWPVGRPHAAAAITWAIRPGAPDDTATHGTDPHR